MSVWFYYSVTLVKGFPRSSVGKDSACRASDPGSFPGLGRSPGEGNSNPPQYSCLENPMDRGAWWATVHGVARVGHDLATKPPTLVKKTFICMYMQNSPGIYVHKYFHIFNYFIVFGLK